MALMESTQQEIGTSIPGFSLKSVDGKEYTNDSFNESQALLMAFICNHCPYVQAIEDRLLALAKAYSVQNLQVVGICSNDPAHYPDDAPEQLLKRWREKDYGFPYLFDETQEVAKDFDAVCTPDLFLYDQNRELYYHGRLDDNWKEPSQVKHQELKEAVDQLLAGDLPPKVQHPAMGCSIKWRD